MAMQTLFGEQTKEAPQKLVTRHSLREAQKKLQVLLAEDNMVNQKLATRLLERAGHRVILAGNGQEAVEAFDTHVLDLILMDVQMPEMDGFEATRVIRKKEQVTHTHIPIIALTANAMKGDREQCLEAGMDDYVSKPIRFDELSEAIARVIHTDND
ncbi:MAG: response regulator [Candidatus Latescibacterota bacterium]